MNTIDEKPIPMVLETETRTVRIPVSDGNIFAFPDGVPAFEDYKQFVLYCNTDMQPFFFMKSIGVTPEVSFVCIDPFLVCPDFQVRVGLADLEKLGLKRGEDAFVFSFVTVHDDPRDITANLQGPVVLNMNNCLGRQVISEGTKHDVRFRVWDALMQSKEEPDTAEAYLNRTQYR
ncbi:flagellar assembly protein FliW [Pontiellaceae bacterium B1224]|nr:flagellar assembly protein FliW [Pontiellaceae bacterium B1224]